MTKREKGRNINVIRCVVIGIMLFFLLFSLSEVIVVPDDKESQIRSSSLKIIVDEQNDTITETFVDEDGTITYAADKQYAIVTKKRQNNTLLEEYFDENGNPAEQNEGNYAVLRVYNNKGQEFRRVYLGRDGQPVSLNTGYSIITRTFDSLDRLKTETFGDTNDSPICTKSAGYGRQYEYNANNRIEKTLYLNKDGNPETTESGYAIIKKYYYEDNQNNGRIDNEFYFDAEEKPVSLFVNQFGLHREYDQFGRARIMTYLDKDGNPIVTTLGYATRVRTFYADDTVKTEMYLDDNGNQIALSHGQYGIKYVDGKEIYLDINGNEFFELSNYLHNHHFGVIIFALSMVFFSILCDKKINTVIMIAYIAFVLYMTLMYRIKGDSGTESELFWSYRQFFSSSPLRREIINNIWLFLPLGTILYKLRPKWIIILFPFLLSVSIEVVQYITGVGICEFDDVLSNSIGSIIGFEVGYEVENIIRRSRGEMDN